MTISQMSMGGLMGSPGLVDCHVHSSCSVDSSAEMEELCRRAVELGLSEICFTEHVDFDPAEVNTGYFRYESYRERIRESRGRFGAHLKIGAGVEIDYNRRFESDIADFLRGKTFDFVLGSVHYLNGFNVSEPRASDYFEGRDREIAYGRYFDEVEHCVRSGMFDALGHLDLVKRFGVHVYGPFEIGPFTDRIERILRLMVEQGMGLEVNTSGLRQAPKEPYPSAEVLRMYKACGGEIVTVGSDAHTTDDVAKGIEEAVRLLRTMDFDSIWVFERRNPRRFTQGH